MQQTPIIPQPQADSESSHPPSFHSPPIEPPKPVKPSKKQRLKSALSTISILLIAPIVALLLTAFVFQSYQVDGPSMETSLYHGDRLIVLKTAKTWADLRDQDFLPERSDIIVFNRTVDNNAHQNRQLIKRVIGLPGDRVVVRDNKLTVFNADFPAGFNPDRAGGYQDYVSPTTPGNVDITVPDNELFVLGDNRPNSLDSRSFGTISSDEVIGTLVFRAYPFREARTF